MEFFTFSPLRILFVFLFINSLAFAAYSQEKEETKSNFRISGFIDAYYGYDFNSPETEKRLPFLYNHTRAKQFAINLGLVTANFEKGRFRANLGIQQGTYAQDNYSAEPKLLRWLNQANAGFALNTSKTVWLDAGLMPSHIGFENAISTKNRTLSRSLIAENSPYFLTGAKLGWQADERWYFSFWVANGWQVVQAIEDNSIPSIGTQANFEWSPKLTLNWSTLIGNNYPDETRRLRYFSNHYLIWNPTSLWEIIAGVDLGWEQQSKISTNSSFWSGGSLILGYELSTNWKAAIRGEYYTDPDGVIATNQNGAGLKTSGFSLNLDRSFRDYLIFRVESRYLISPESQFLSESRPSNSDFFLLASISIHLH
ncbi:porin [Algoriphagus antarcticus]|uniref:Putative OmpL-like beta-barrel porin-2 n=1 Tax=Algoriphagus antarcticus TaxID=238540 RepID=A0A3E0DS80_9BACT|nr:porin [Algoriphagus antarcticus]REG86399.1 putative OmpL-like beta-barrel porin-2 [Algoriphagus antarcticus]